MVFSDTSTWYKEDEFIEIKNANNSFNSVLTNGNQSSRKKRLIISFLETL